MENRKLRGGMVGGGRDSLIGPVHRMAATMDGQAEFVAGAFSSDPEKSRSFGQELNLDASRVYADYNQMAEKEAELPPDKRIDFVSITTPNVYHFDIAKRFLEAGFNVICDKPMTYSLAEAKELKSIVEKSGKVFSLTHNYNGYPMVKQARSMVRDGLVGNINKVVVDYPQGWLAILFERGDLLPRIWRLDPEKSGISCCVGDIGVHAETLARYITGLEIEELCADLSSFIPKNLLDDDGSILIHYKGGAKGIINVSQISTGEGNALSIRIYGTTLSLAWNQENPNILTSKDIKGCTIVYSKGERGLSNEARKASRLPLGQPEGFIETFANIYLETFKAIRTKLAGQPIPECDYPTVDDGVIGMSFVETVVASATSDNKWTKMLQ